MSVTGRTRHAIALAIAAMATISIAACESTPTAPALTASTARPAAIQGDTLECTHGWHIVNGWYACN